ncbi:MAG: hypothetical protein Tsb0021_17310 [Chlamydiales bacterium]
MMNKLENFKHYIHASLRAVTNWCTGGNSKKKGIDAKVSRSGLEGLKHLLKIEKKPFRKIQVTMGGLVQFDEESGKLLIRVDKKQATRLYELTQESRKKSGPLPLRVKDQDLHITVISSDEQGNYSKQDLMRYNNQAVTFTKFIGFKILQNNQLVFVIESEDLKRIRNALDLTGEPPNGFYFPLS